MRLWAATATLPSCTPWGFVAGDRRISSVGHDVLSSGFCQGRTRVVDRKSLIFNCHQSLTVGFASIPGVLTPA